MILLTVEKQKHRDSEKWRGCGGMWAQHTWVAMLRRPASGHGSGLGHVAGRQAGQRHLYGGAFSGSSLGWRCFGRA